MQIKKIFLSTVIIVLTVVTTVNAQTKMKDGTVTGSSNLPNSNAILELESNNRGLLLPRIALTATASPSPLSAHVKGLEVYNTAQVNDVDSGLYFNDGTKWIRVSSSVDSATAWLLQGNSGTNAGTNLVGNAADGNYVGTKDVGMLVLGVAGTKRAILDSAGNVIFGLNNTDSASNTLVGGSNNIAKPTGTGSLLSGAFNSTYAPFTIMAGNTNMDSSFSGNNAVFGAANKTISGNGFLSGQINSIDSGSEFSAVVGRNNTVGQNAPGSLLSGAFNRSYAPFTIMAGNTNVDSSIKGNNAVFGILNKTASGISFLSGQFNSIDSGSEFSAVVGENNTVEQNAGGSLLSGAFNSTYAPFTIMAGNTNVDSSIKGNNAIFGIQNKTASGNSFLSGQFNSIDSGAEFSAVVGQSNTVEQNAGGSFLSGVFNSTYAPYTIIAGIGNTITDSMEAAAVVGMYNQPVTNTLLAVGNGNSSSAQSNAITVTNTSAAPAATANNSTLNVNGSLSLGIKNITTDYTLQGNDYRILVRDGDPTVNITITLPDPTTCLGRVYVIQNLKTNNAGTGNILFSRDINEGAGNIVTAGNPVLYNYYTNGTAITLQSDGNEWVGMVQ